MRGHIGLALIVAACGIGVGCLQLVGWEDPRLDAPDAGAGGASSGSDGAGAGSSSTGGSCGAVCRNDLQAVVDGCTGEVVTTCTPDEGCADGACMPDPCKAAELSGSSYGCDYWAVKTAQRFVDFGACFAVVVANSWPKPVHLQVDRGGTQLKPEMFTYIPEGTGQNITYNPYDPIAGIDPGQVAILFLSRSGSPLIDCPKPAAISAETGVDGTGRGTAFHITSDYPIVATQFNPYGAAVNSAGAASMLLATSGWGKEHVAISAYKASPVVAQGMPSLDLLAREDKTDVTITPVADITAGPNVAGAPAGKPVTYTLNRGEFLQITQPAELTGSPIHSTSAIAMLGAHPCMTIPLMDPDFNSAQQQIPPLQGLGNEYIGVRYRNRTVQNEAPPWRIIGAADGTALSWSPSPPPGAPQKLNAGQIAEFTSSGPFVVKSQDAGHRFYLGAYMTVDPDHMNTGAPQWVNVVPPTQYLSQYVFFTDPAYPETSLIVVRTPSRVDGKTFADVKLECLGKPLDGWQPIGNYEYTRVDLASGKFLGVGGCNNGRQVMSSSLPFGVTVWSWGTFATGTSGSYAYPAGASYQLASP